MPWWLDVLLTVSFRAHVLLDGFCPDCGHVVKLRRRPGQAMWTCRYCGSMGIVAKFNGRWTAAESPEEAILQMNATCRAEAEAATKNGEADTERGVLGDIKQVCEQLTAEARVR
jgi:ribosomal protein L37AE/L43A